MYVTLYIAAIVAANLAVVRFGPGVMPIIAFFLIGLDLTLRDRLHDRWADGALWPRMLGLIAIAGAVSFLLNPAVGMIALASVTAFCAASLADAATYQLLHRQRWALRANGSNLAGAMVDSLMFPLLAFGAIPAWIVLAQFAAKVAGGALWAYLISESSPVGGKSD